MKENYLKKELYDLVKRDSSIFEFLQEGSLDGMWYWDLENPENEWMSPRFWELFGIDYTTKEHKANEWQNIIFKEDLEVAYDNFLKHVADPNHPYDQIVRYRHTSGKTIWVRCRGVAIRDENGKAIRMIGAHQDITELKNLQEELTCLIRNNEQSKLLLTASLNSPSGIIILSLDKNYNYLYFNEAHKISMKVSYNSDIEIGKCIFDYMTREDDISRIKINYDKALEGQTHVTLEKYGDIDAQYFETIFNPIKDNDNKIIGVSAFAREITERVIANQQLKESKSELKTILDTTAEAIFGTDLNNNCTFVNRSFLEILGYSSEKEVIGKNIHDLIHHHDEFGKPLLRSECPLEKLIVLKQEVIDGAYVFWKKDQTPINVSLTSKKIYKNNKIVGQIVSFKDITETKKLESTLRNQERLARKYLDIAEVIMLVLNKKGEVVLINKKGCKILGYKEEDILGKNWFDNYIPKNIKEIVKGVFNDVLDNKSKLAINYLNLVVNSKGEERMISWHNSVLYDENNKIIGILSSGEDVTEVLKVTERLKENETRYREIVNNLEAGVVIHDSDTSIKSFNERASVMLAIKESDLKGMKVYSKAFNFISESGNLLDVSEYPVSLIVKSKQPLKNYTMGIKNPRNDEVVWVSVNGVPLKNADDVIDEIVISFVDITFEKTKRDEIEYMGNHDFLTNLYNRRYFVEKFKELDKDEHYPIGIIMLDVNGLKIINDAFGHKMGDIALKKVAVILKNASREEDVVCRIGGDEFAIIQPNITEKEIEKIVSNIKLTSKKELVRNIPLSLASGYEIKEKKSLADRDEILKLAENHMYRHKLSEGISIRNNAIKAILKTLTEKYEEERVHSKKVSQICRQIGVEIDLKDDELKELVLAGMYHDIGKISIPDAILNKPGKLTDEEFTIIKTHPEISYQILRAADEYSDLAIHALYHHERIDGKGYPSGKKGNSIPLFSRIISVADAFEAMTAERVYKESLSEAEAIQEIIRCSGTQFDTEIAKVFVEKVLKKNWILNK